MAKVDDLLERRAKQVVLAIVARLAHRSPPTANLVVEGITDRPNRESQTAGKPACPPGFLAKSITCSGQIIAIDQSLPNSSRTTVKFRTKTSASRSQLSAVRRSLTVIAIREAADEIAGLSPAFVRCDAHSLCANFGCTGFLRGNVCQKGLCRVWHLYWRCHLRPLSIQALKPILVCSELRPDQCHRNPHRPQSLVGRSVRSRPSLIRRPAWRTSAIEECNPEINFLIQMASYSSR